MSVSPRPTWMHGDLQEKWPLCHVATALGSGRSSLVGVSYVPGALDPVSLTKGCVMGLWAMRCPLYTRGGGAGDRGPTCGWSAASRKWSPMRTQGTKARGLPGGDAPCALPGGANTTGDHLIPTCVLAAINITVSTPAAGSTSALPHADPEGELGDPGLAMGVRHEGGRGDVPDRFTFLPSPSPVETSEGQPVNSESARPIPPPSNPLP